MPLNPQNEPEDRPQPCTCTICHVKTADIRFHRCNERNDEKRPGKFASAEGWSMSETIKWREPRREVKRPVEYDDFLHVADVTPLTIADLKIPRCEYRGGVPHVTRHATRENKGSS